MRRNLLIAVGLAFAAAAAAQTSHLVDLGEQMQALAAPAGLLQGCTDVPEAVQLADTLRLRGIAVDRALADLARKKDEIAAAESQLKSRLVELREARKALSDTKAARKDETGAGIERLIAVYDAMKPAEAANVLSTLPADFAAEILIRVQPETSAKIMASIEPSQAAILTTFMGARRVKAN